MAELMNNTGDKYNTFHREVVKMAENMDADTERLNKCMKERNDLILKFEQRTLYLEHIVREMVLEQE